MTKKLHRESLIVAVILLILLGACIYLDSILPSYHIVIKVIKKAAVYSLVAVSMNLLNGFTGLFSLGQAGARRVCLRRALHPSRQARGRVSAV